MKPRLIDEFDRIERTLVVVAHPDDAEARAGGTIARIARGPGEVRIILCTDGSKGSQEPGADVASLARLRQKEQRAAAGCLGITETCFLGHPDGELENTSGLRRELVQNIRSFRPDLVITHDPWAQYQLHPDHRATGWAACDAVMAARGPLYYPDVPVPHTVPELWLMATTSPDIFVDISTSLDRKLEALACHVSQRDHEPEMREKVTRRDRGAGQLVGVEFAELFRRLALSVAGPATGQQTFEMIREGS